MTTTEKTTEKADMTFTDTAGKEWTLALTVPRLKALEAVLGCHPRKLIAEPERLLALLADEARLAAVGHALLPPVGAGVVPTTLERFSESLDAEALDRIAEITIRQVCGFFAARGRAKETADAIVQALRDAGAAAAEVTARAGGGDDQPTAAA